VEATKWFRKAAEQESAAAQYNLGVAYTSGQGVETNFVEAVKWFSKAAENGIPQAQFNLGIAYANGIGVVENAQAAYGWFLIAASGEYDPAKSMVASLEQSLSLAEQETARSWAKQWQLKKTDTREQDDDSTQLTGRRQPKSATQQGEPRFKDERHPQQESYRIGLNHDGSPAVTTTPRWQAQGTAAKDGVRVFDEHQYFAAHYGRFGGAFETAREASDKAKALNVQQTVNLDVMKEAAYNSGPGLSRGNIRLGHWTYEYNATVDSFVVYQE
jgi:hypothetical protein